MNMGGRFFAAGTILLAGLLLLSACAQKPQSVAQVRVIQAAVTHVGLSQIESVPVKLTARVSGLLPSTCAKLADPIVESSGTLIVVILPAQMPEAGCAGGSVTFEREIDLGTFTQTGNYTVTVNGVQAMITLLGAPVTGPTTAPTMQVTAQPPEPTAAPSEPTSTPADQPEPTKVGSAEATKEPTAVPTQPPVVDTSGGTSECVNKAAFFADVTVPDGTLFDPGAAFTKTWKVRNAGTCVWSGYALIFIGGDELSKEKSMPLAGAVSPDGVVEVSVKMVAPDAPGGYLSNWQLSSSAGETFGTGAARNGALWAKIGVRSLVPVDTKPVCAYQTDASYEADLLGRINSARQERGLAALKLVPGLTAAARIHSQDMACNDFVEHYGSDGSTWYTRIQTQGVKYGSANENIYAGTPAYGGDPEGAFTWWMNSQVHRDNILNPKSTMIGIGYIFYDGSTYKGYYTLDFAGSK